MAGHSGEEVGPGQQLGEAEHERRSPESAQGKSAVLCCAMLFAVGQFRMLGSGCYLNFDADDCMTIYVTDVQCFPYSMRATDTEASTAKLYVRTEMSFC